MGFSTDRPGLLRRWSFLGKKSSKILAECNWEILDAIGVGKLIVRKDIENQKLQLMLPRSCQACRVDSWRGRRKFGKSQLIARAKECQMTASFNPMKSNKISTRGSVQYFSKKINTVYVFLSLVVLASRLDGVDVEISLGCLCKRPFRTRDPRRHP